MDEHGTTFRGLQPPPARRGLDRLLWWLAYRVDTWTPQGPRWWRALVAMGYLDPPRPGVDELKERHVIL